MFSFLLCAQEPPSLTEKPIIENELRVCRVLLDASSSSSSSSNNSRVLVIVVLVLVVSTSTSTSTSSE